MTTEREETIRIVRLLTHRILEQAHAAGGFMDLLQGNVHVHEMSDVDRYRLYQQTNDCLRRLTDLAGTLNDLAYYSGVDRIERIDRVLINIECAKLAEGQREPVAYRSDIPDYYAVKTNRQSWHSAGRWCACSAACSMPTRTTRKARASSSASPSESQQQKCSQSV